jgi:hypothetical protein
MAVAALFRNLAAFSYKPVGSFESFAAFLSLAATAFGCPPNTCGRDHGKPLVERRLLRRLKLPTQCS